MTATDTIARILFDEGGADERVRSYEIADAVIAAVRAMPVEDQAELIGGTVVADHFVVAGPR
jgi:hypothetical protein